MAIAPIEGTPPEIPGPGLHVLEGGRHLGAPPRRTALHARDDRAEALRRSRAAHPTATARPGQPAAPSPRTVVAPIGAPWSDPCEVPRSAAAQRHGDPIRSARASASGRRDPAIRAQTLARRRRTMAAGVVLLAVVLLAMPLRALGAVTVSGQPTPGGVPAGLAPGTIYVVQPGDTLESIAARVNASELATIERQLASSTGSSTVVAGEHVTIP
jgi:LysM repeat protein